MEFVKNSTVELIKTNASDVDVARAAWVSNFGEDAREKDTGRIDGLINYLYSNRHMSPFEHGSFTFFIETPLFVAREFMRHRTFSYNEISGRYTQLPARFYVPDSERPLIQHGKVGAYNFTEGTREQYAVTRRMIEANAEEAWVRYQRMIDEGVAREVARMVLPVNTMTQFYATVNPRNLMQFLDLRNESQALYEIREVAVQMDAHFKDTMPITHAAYSKHKEYVSNLVIWEELYRNAKAEVEDLKRQLNEVGLET